MPVLAVGGEKSFEPIQAVIMRHVATNVQEAVIAGLSDRALERSVCDVVKETLRRAGT